MEFIHTRRVQQLTRPQCRNILIKIIALVSTNSGERNLGILNKLYCILCYGFRRRPFVVYDPYDSVQADLLFYNNPEYYTHNSYYKYILTVIDVFSKVAYAAPLKTKQTTEVAAALDKIIAQMPITPRKFMVDAGTEFSGASNSIYNIIVKKYKVLDILSTYKR